jgi:ABC-type sugar transport system ATPase subunit
MTHQKLLEMKGISKTYPGVVALDKVEFDLEEGEVHALVGENGAGKSTLIKILMGIERLDEGTISIRGKEVDIQNPLQAAEHGISAVFQELSLVPTLTLGENVFLNKEGKQSQYYLSRKEIFSKTEAILKKYNITHLKANEIVSDMSPPKRQLSEIIKAIASEPRILILDEPTSALTDNETEKLFDIIRSMKADGVGIIYISHRMKELELLADRVSVLRDGKYVGSKNMSEVSLDEIIKMMVGRSLELYQTAQVRSIDRSAENISLEVKGLHKKGLFEDISFQLFKGEILGVAGLLGSGRAELMDLIFGIDRLDGGEIFIEGEKVHINSVQDALDHGIALIPESRHLQGLILIHSIADNMSLPVLKRFQKGLILNHRKKNEFALEMISKYAIKTDSPTKPTGQLSGGNQQKVVVAKWLATGPKILIVVEPTVGIDVGSKVEIHKVIRNLTDEGVSVIMISSEMNELLTNSDRIMVMNDHKILGTFEDIDQEEIMSEIMTDINKGDTKEDTAHV